MPALDVFSVFLRELRGEMSLCSLVPFVVKFFSLTFITVALP